MNFKSLFRKAWSPIPLATVLFAFWVIFSGMTDWRHLLLGAVVALGLSVFSSYLLRGRLDPQLGAGVLLRFPLFSTLLFWEIIKANWDVVKRVLAPSLPISPRIIEFDSFLESDMGKAILANSITLTPGTVTVDIEGSRFFVHCLAAEHGEDLLDGKLERMTAWLVGEGPVEMRRLH